MKQLLKLVVTLMCLAVIAACGGSSKPPVTNSVKAVISAKDGGKLETADGSSITIPRGALAEDTEITMTVISTEEFNAAGDKTEYATKIMDFEPNGLIFLKPVVISSPASKDINGLISAAVFNVDDKSWHYNKEGVAVVMSKDEMGDPIMQSAMGDPIMLNAMGDPIMDQAMGDPIMLSAAGDPIMISGMGDPIMGAAMGDPIMMTTGHFSDYTFVVVPDQPVEPDGDPVKPDEDTEPEPDETPRPDEEIVLDEDVIDEDIVDEDVVPECEEEAKECVENTLKECVNGSWSETACDFGCDTENSQCFECEVTEEGNYRCHEDVRQVCVNKYWADWTDETGAPCVGGCNAFTNDCNVWENGSIVTLGTYEQDNNAENGAEPIEWIVYYYDQESGMAELVSKYGLDSKPYMTTSASTSGYYYYQSSFWGDSSIRTWLNDEFYSAAFTTLLQDAMIVTLPSSTDSDYEGRRNIGRSFSDYESKSDRVFLVQYAMAAGSAQPAEETAGTSIFTQENSTRVCMPTAYAIARGADVSPETGAGKWWLEEGRYYVEFDGNLRYIDTGDDPYVRDVATNPLADGSVMVRPAIVVRLSPDTCTEAENGQHRCIEVGGVSNSQICSDGYWVDVASCTYGCDTAEGANYGTCFDCSTENSEENSISTCENDRMYSCQAGRWVSGEEDVCEFGCNTYGSACNECTPGTMMCSSTQGSEGQPRADRADILTSNSMICNYYGYWTVKEECGDMGCNETSKECNCVNDAFSCDGGTSKKCVNHIWSAPTVCEFGCVPEDGSCAEGYAVGNKINMGSFELDNNDANGVESVSWYIIATDNTGLFLLSENSVARMRWDDDSNIWADSEIREWLNGEFYDSAFTSSQKAKIRDTELADVETTDKVFLLSQAEYEALPDYMKIATLGGESAYWWLRTPDEEKTEPSAMQVDTDGSFYGSYHVSYDNDTMRPAMWINR